MSREDQHYVKLRSLPGKLSKKVNDLGDGIDSMHGMSGAGKVVLQSLRFKKSTFSINQVKDWLKDHKMTAANIEPATNTSTLQHVTMNFSGDVRHDQMEGRDFIVCPCVSIVEGVHNGSAGPVFYSAEELAKTPEVWNAKPVVVYHPEINGQGVSACDPVILSNRKVGVMMKTEFVPENNGLRHEIWIDVDMANKVDTRIMEAINNSEVMEVSTGLFTDNIIEDGEWNGEEFEAIATNFRPDHLALLPDKTGACSVEDGAGFLRVNTEEDTGTISQQWADAYFPHLTAMGIDVEKMTKLELSHDGTRQQLWKLLDDVNGDAWVDEVFNNTFIYAVGGKLFRQGYATVNDVVSLVGTPEEVVRVVEFQAVTNVTSVVKGNKMKDKKEIVDGLIANDKSAFGEDNREFLESQDVEILEKMVPVEVKEAPATPAKEVPAGNTEAVVTLTAEQEMAKYIGEAPSALQAVFRDRLSVYDAEKKRLVASIIGNKRNAFTELELVGKDVAELRNLAALAQVDETIPFPGRYDGLAGVQNNDDDGGEVPVPPAIMTAVMACL